MIEIEKLTELAEGLTLISEGIRQIAVVEDSQGLRKDRVRITIKDESGSKGTGSIVMLSATALTPIINYAVRNGYGWQIITFGASADAPAKAVMELYPFMPKMA